MVTSSDPAWQSNQFMKMIYAIIVVAVTSVGSGCGDAPPRAGDLALTSLLRGNAIDVESVEIDGRKLSKAGAERFIAFLRTSTDEATTMALKRKRGETRVTSHRCSIT